MFGQEKPKHNYRIFIFFGLVTLGLLVGSYEEIQYLTLGESAQGTVIKTERVKYRDSDGIEHEYGIIHYEYQNEFLNNANTRGELEVTMVRYFGYKVGQALSIEYYGTKPGSSRLDKGMRWGWFVGIIVIAIFWTIIIWSIRNEDKTRIHHTKVPGSL